MNMLPSIIQSPPAVTRRSYAAKYAVDYFERKQIPSYALWAIVMKDPATGRYDKLPAGYGRTGTLEEAHLDLTAWCEARGLTFADLRQEMIPWRLVKDLLEGKSGAEFFARGVKRRAVAGQVLSIPKPETDLVHVAGGRACTNSRTVAEKFGKHHKNVLRAIDKLPHDEFWRLHFEPRDYLTERGKTERHYEITWQGFSILAMGFTGQRAYEWKRDFLDAFEAMGDYIVRHTQAIADPPRTGLLADKRAANKTMNGALVEVRAEVGKETSENHYRCEAKLCNGVLTGRFEKLDEKALSNADLELLELIRDRNRAFILAGLDYADRKAKLQQYALRQRTRQIADGRGRHQVEHMKMAG
jgi:Rha family phage regulatory protein